MQTSVTFKNLESSEHLTAYVSNKLNRFDKYLENPAEANVVLSVEKFRHIAEISIVGDRLNIYGKEETSDMYSAIDMVLDKIEKQIKKNKEKVKDRRSGAKGRPRAEAPELFSAEEERRESGRVIVEPIEYKPMDVDEALMQMDLNDEPFFVFTNARTDRVNVLYKRKDGNFGLIQPNN
ncbi:MAG: ribosome-associated translation inhibitor RaiA [Thermodesulfobacteriota bacterium]